MVKFEKVELITKIIAAVILFALMWVMVGSCENIFQHIVRAGFAELILYAAWEYLAETGERRRLSNK